MVCSNPWNLDVSSVMLQSTWLGLEVYSKTMGTSMRGLVKQHAEELAKNTRVDLKRVRNIKYLFEFDRSDPLYLTFSREFNPFVESSKAQLGGILLREHTTEMHLLVTPCLLLGYHFWP